LFDPFGRMTLPVFTGQVEVNLSLVFFVPWWGFFEWPLRVNPLCRDPHLLEVVEGLFEEPLLNGVSVLRSSSGFSHCIDDTLEYCGVEVLSLRDILC